jgi:3-deoxy-7-phosphoheptulonate synthase
MLETVPFRLAAKEKQPGGRSIFDIKGIKIGAEKLAVMAGPCAVESPEQMDAIAQAIARSGATILRGGAFKPRTSPYSFQGLGERGLQYLHEAAQKHELLSVSEVMDGEHLAMTAEYVDILQIGSRNMQNFSLLKKLGSVNRPILLKRGHAATYADFLMAAEYILNAGNSQVILCERGIRTFETYTRNTLDVAAVPILHELSHLPVIVDPSHGTGLRSAVLPMARAAVAAGADGLMIEVHPDPNHSISDKEQTLSPTEFDELMQSISAIASAIGRHA